MVAMKIKRLLCVQLFILVKISICFNGGISTIKFRRSTSLSRSDMLLLWSTSGVNLVKCAVSADLHSEADYLDFIRTPITVCNGYKKDKSGTDVYFSNLWIRVCPHGSVYYTPANLCYQINSRVNIDYNDAYFACLEQGYYLTVLSSTTRYQFLTEMIGQTITETGTSVTSWMVDATINPMDNNYYWITGPSIDENTTPIKREGNLSCLQIKKFADFIGYNDMDCSPSPTVSFICEYFLN